MKTSTAIKTWSELDPDMKPMINSFLQVYDRKGNNFVWVKKADIKRIDAIDLQGEGAAVVRVYVDGTYYQADEYDTLDEAETSAEKLSINISWELEEMNHAKDKK